MVPLRLRSQLRWRNLKRWICGLLGCLIFTLGCQGSTAPPLPQDATQTLGVEEQILSPPPPQAQSPPDVSSDRLKDHLTTLSVERHSNLQRQETQNYIESILTQNHWQIEEQAFAGGVNIIARQPQHNLGQGEILVGAHYDTIAGTPGADDNATGVAAVLELSYLFRDYPSPKNLTLAFFDLEENGAIGSFAYTNIAKNLEHLDGAVILEMLGYTCHTPKCQKIPPGLEVRPPSQFGDFISAIGDTEHPYLLDAFRQVSAPELPLLALDVPFKGILSPILLRSDHAAFWLQGKGAVMVSDTAFLRNPHYHRPSDTLSTIDLDFFTQSTKLVVQATALLLNRP